MKTKEELVKMFEEDIDELHKDFLVAPLQSSRLEIFDKLSMSYSLLLHYQDRGAEEVTYAKE